jgi:hypothetical protein
MENEEKELVKVDGVVGGNVERCWNKVRPQSRQFIDCFRGYEGGNRIKQGEVFLLHRLFNTFYTFRFVFSTPNNEDMRRHSGSTSNNPCLEKEVYGWYRGGAGQKYTARVTIYINKKLLPRLRCNDLVAQYIIQHVLVHKRGHWVRITDYAS